MLIARSSNPPSAEISATERMSPRPSPVVSKVSSPGAPEWLIVIDPIVPLKVTREQPEQPSPIVTEAKSTRSPSARLKVTVSVPEAKPRKQFSAAKSRNPATLKKMKGGSPGLLYPENAWLKNGSGAQPPPLLKSSVIVTIPVEKALVALSSMGAADACNASREADTGRSSGAASLAVPIRAASDRRTPKRLPAGCARAIRPPASCNFIDAFLGLIAFSIGSVRPEGATCMN